MEQRGRARELQLPLREKWRPSASREQRTRGWGFPGTPPSLWFPFQEQTMCEGKRRGLGGFEAIPIIPGRDEGRLHQ